LIPNDFLEDYVFENPARYGKDYDVEILELSKYKNEFEMNMKFSRNGIQKYIET
jgi:hypothetical protein